MYLIDTVLVRNQTISRTLCVDPPTIPLWAFLGSACCMNSEGGGTSKSSDAQVK